MSKKFKLGQRVVRKEDIFAKSSPLMHGTVVRSYSKPLKVLSDGTHLGPYNELYDVQWDNYDEVSKEYLPHGISKESNNEVS